MKLENLEETALEITRIARHGHTEARAVRAISRRLDELIQTAVEKERTRIITIVKKETFPIITSPEYPAVWWETKFGMTIKLSVSHLLNRIIEKIKTPTTKDTNDVT